MKYHDYIWDLGGTLLDNYETSTALCRNLSPIWNRARTRPCLRSFEGFDSFAIEKFAPDIEDFLENYKENEARELEHPVLFEGIPELLKDISDKGGRHFLVSHRNDQVLELLLRPR